MNRLEATVGNATRGVVFDIKEFALYDGPGVRCTIFMKGCPLRCSWCHNPEGLAREPEYMKTAAWERQVGRVYQVDELVAVLLRYEPIFRAVTGGVTFSGGEPLLQADFVAAAMRMLKGRLHLLLQTSGFANEEDFLSVIALSDLVFFDLKILRSDLHRRHTGCDNRRILANLVALDRSGTPYRIRMPMIPGVTDTEENYDLVREFIQTRLGRTHLQGLDMLPYNQAAGGKYEGVGRRFTPGFDANTKERILPEYFQDLIREVVVL